MPYRVGVKTQLASRFVSLLIRVLISFRQNQGLLLSGAVAYYTLLSLLPFLILTLILLSHFIEEEQLFVTLSTFLGLAIPVYAATITEQIHIFLANRSVIGIVGFVVLLFFSSIAFTVLENAMAIIFLHRARVQRRHFLISAVLPFIYMLLIAVGIFMLTVLVGVVDALVGKQIELFGWTIKLGGAVGFLLYALGLAGEMLMLTSVYLVMPVGRISLRHAAAGGIVATILWEITRRIFIWYYTHFSFVNLVYGSLTTAVVFLLSIEAAVLILLLGAQVNAELEAEAYGLR